MGLRDGFINLPKIDPLNVPLLNIQPGPESPVNIDLILKNNLLTGLKDAKAISVSGFERDMSKKHEIILQIPQVHMTGDYNVKGQVIALPVEGNGKHEITLNDINVILHFTGTPYVKNGRTYMKIDDLTVGLTPKKVVFNFDNLFHGDKVLTENVNNFVNENWLEIFTEIRSSLINGLSPVLQKIVNDVFSKLPYEEFFAKPSGGVTRCHRGDNACFTQSAQEVLHKYPGGLRDLDLLPFDPLRVNSLTLERNPSSPVNIELKFKELDLFGLKTAQVKAVKGFTFEGRSELEAVVPEFVLKGKYNADGRVLILPIVGSGNSIISCKNLQLKYSFDLKPVEKNGKVFAALEHVKLEFKPELVQFHFENLFNGDKALGDNMNKFLNENWRDIYNELEPGFAKSLSLVAKQMINNILAKHPYDVLFA
ncbi:protein takeout-like [Calliphora vicina]|uniref:protein takeout-like n=1 Tax=Calliphora vicina TaxID=7373 RepID=UPI00325A80C3